MSLKVFLAFFIMLLLPLLADEDVVTIERLQAQLAAKDAEVVKWKKYAEDIKKHEAWKQQILMFSIDGCVGKQPDPPKE